MDSPFRKAEIERKILTTIRRREGACLHMKMLVPSSLARSSLIGWGGGPDIPGEGGGVCSEHESTNFGTLREWRKKSENEDSPARLANLRKE